nr:APC family permease [Streptomyces albus]
MDQTPGAQTNRSSPPLRQALTTPLLYFFILGDVLGAGAYVLVGQVAAESGPAVWLPLTAALCLALLTAASYAELATRSPRAGGAAHYAALAYGPFVGFETSVNVAEETRDPRRSYPRALFGALLTAGLVYLLVGCVAAAAVPAHTLVHSSGPLLEVVREAGGVPPRLFSVVALVAVANGALLTGIMASRLAFGMARDGLLPGVLSRVLPGRRTPWVAVVATTALSLLLALTGSVAVLASTLVLLLLVVFFLVNTAALVLRRRPAERDHFRTPAVVPVLGAVSCVLLATQVEAEVWLRGAAVLAVGLVLAVVAALRRRAGRRPEPERKTPGRHPEVVGPGPDAAAKDRHAAEQGRGAVAQGGDAVEQGRGAAVPLDDPWDGPR